jgi:hypothetical protein
MRMKGMGSSVPIILAVGFLLLTVSCGPGRSVTQTAIAQTQVQQTAEEATRIAPTSTPTPTKTPIPTDTPVPTPTEMKESVMDAEDDCEAVTGILGEGGCPVDIEILEILPCENPGFYTFRVVFYHLKDPLTTNVCFLINIDGIKETGFENEGFLGIDWEYCWMPETEKVVAHSFDEIGDFVDTVVISNPLNYVSSDPEGDDQINTFWMTFPPLGLRDLEIAANAEAIAQGLFYDSSGTMVFDGSQPILLSSCPAAE